MREYGRIETRFWTDAKIMRLSNCAKLMMAYLLTGPHTNCIGCFRLPTGYIEADMGWVSETVTETLSELLREGLIERGEMGWTLIVSFLKYNPIENPNVGKAAMSYIQTVPSHIVFYQRLIASLIPYVKRFPEGYLDGLAKGLPNKEPEPILDPEKESVVLSITSPEIVSDEPTEQEPKTFSEIESALHVWNDLAEELGLSKVQKLTEARKVKLKTRLKDVGGIAGWAKVLVKIRDSRFLCGNNKNGWRADFDFVLQESSFNRLKEGAYSDKEHEIASEPMTFRLSSDVISKLKSAGFAESEIKKWFDTAHFLDKGKRIQVHSDFVRSWIINHYESRLQRAFGCRPELEVVGP